MGLVGFLAIPMTTGVDLVLAAPQDFLAHPANWMQWISDWRGTATAGPNFSWVLGDPGAAAIRWPRPVVVDPRPVGRRARRPRRDGRLRRRRRAARIPARGGVPGVRDGRGGDRRDVPTARAGDGVRHRRSRRARARPCRQARRRRRSRRVRRQRSAPAVARPGGSRPGDPRRRPGHLRGASGASRRGTGHPRHVGDVRATTAGPTPPPRCSTTIGCARAIWPTNSTASWCCAGGSRT